MHTLFGITLVLYALLLSKLSWQKSHEIFMQSGIFCAGQILCDKTLRQLLEFFQVRSLLQLG